MPLERFVLILVVVIAAAGVTVWVAATVIAMWGAPALGVTSLVAIAISAYVAIRLIRQRTTSRTDDHYDRIER